MEGEEEVGKRTGEREGKEGGGGGNQIGTMVLMNTRFRGLFK